MSFYDLEDNCFRGLKELENVEDYLFCVKGEELEIKSIKELSEIVD